VALSNSLWMYCAFLGIARPWRYSMPFAEVAARQCAHDGEERGTDHADARWPLGTARAGRRSKRPT
jgi:hypothetical protein